MRQIIGAELQDVNDPKKHHVRWIKRRDVDGSYWCCFRPRCVRLAVASDWY